MTNVGCWTSTPCFESFAISPINFCETGGFPQCASGLIKPRGRRGLVIQNMEIVFDPAGESLVANESGRNESSRV